MMLVLSNSVDESTRYNRAGAGVMEDYDKTGLGLKVQTSGYLKRKVHYVTFRTLDSTISWTLVYDSTGIFLFGNNDTHTEPEENVGIRPTTEWEDE